MKRGFFSDMRFAYGVLRANNQPRRVRRAFGFALFALAHRRFT